MHNVTEVLPALHKICQCCHVKIAFTRITAQTQMTSCHGSRHLGARSSWDSFPSLCNTQRTQLRWHSTGTKSSWELARGLSLRFICSVLHMQSLCHCVLNLRKHPNQGFLFIYLFAYSSSYSSNILLFHLCYFLLQGELIESSSDEEESGLQDEKRSGSMFDMEDLGNIMNRVNKTKVC